MVLDRAVGRDIEKVLGDEQRHEGHHLQIGLERLEFFPDLRVLVGRRLIDRQLGSDCGFLEWIGLGAFFFRGNIDRNHIFTALEQRLEHGLAKGLLPVNDDTHSQLPPQLVIAGLVPAIPITRALRP